MRIINRFLRVLIESREADTFYAAGSSFSPILCTVCLSLLSRFPLLSLLSILLSQGQSDFSHSHSLPASLVLSCRLISGSSVIGLLANWPAGCQTQQRPSRLGHSGDCPPPLSIDSHQLPLSPSQHWLLLWRGCLSSCGAYTHTHTHAHTHFSLFSSHSPSHSSLFGPSVCPLTHCLWKII